MLVLKAVHEALLKSKDAEIASLKDEVSWLRNFIQPPKAYGNAVHYEADHVLEGRQYEPPSNLDKERRELIEIEREQLLNGTY